MGGAGLGADLVYAGIALILAGVAALLVVALRSEPDEGRATVAGGAVVMIGPVPIVFGSDFKWAGVAIALAIVLLVLWFFLWWA